MTNDNFSWKRRKRGIAAVALLSGVSSETEMYSADGHRAARKLLIIESRDQHLDLQVSKQKQQRVNLINIMIKRAYTRTHAQHARTHTRTHAQHARTHARTRTHALTHACHTPARTQAHAQFYTHTQHTKQMIQHAKYLRLVVLA